MTKQKLTPWFPASVKPAREGWYDTRLHEDPATRRILRFWTGRWWSCWDMRDTRSATQTWLWRGLAEQPK